MFLAFAGTGLAAANPVAKSVASAETPIKISVIAFGGKVTIVTQDGQPLKAAKELVIPVGSTISTANNSWIDLSQGGISTIRVMARTKTFTVQQSAFNKTTKQSTSLFKLRHGAVFIKANKAALTQGSKYQVQMPELIAGVLGSECECVNGPDGSTVFGVKGNIVAQQLVNGNPVGDFEKVVPGNTLVRGRTDPENTGILPTPPEVIKKLEVTSVSMLTPQGDALAGRPREATTAEKNAVANDEGAAAIDVTAAVANGGVSPVNTEKFQTTPVPSTPPLQNDSDTKNIRPDDTINTQPTTPPQDSSPSSP